jgi:penicillin-binding protein 2
MLASTPTTPTVALPTLAPTPLPESYQLSGAEDAARRFLDAWDAFDYATMHSLISFTARDTTPLADFVALYEDVQAELTLEGLTFTPVTLMREQPSVVAMVYHATFDTVISDNIEDTDRTMRLVVDPIDLNWRVAWSVADIFQELGAGKALQLDYTVPRRANIYDRNGELLADMNGRMVVLNLVKGRIPLYADCLATLALVLDQPTERVLATLDRFGADWLAEVGLLEPPAYLQYEPALVTYCGQPSTVALCVNTPTVRSCRTYWAPWAIPLKPNWTACVAWVFLPMPSLGERASKRVGIPPCVGCPAGG